MRTPVVGHSPAFTPGTDLQVRRLEASPRTLAREAHYRRPLAFADALAALLVGLLAAAAVNEPVTPWLAVGPIAVVLLAKLVGAYDGDRDRLAKTTLEEMPRLFQVATLYALILGIGAPLLYGRLVEPVQLLVAAVSMPLLLLALRTLARRLTLGVAAAERVVVIGHPVAAEKINRKLAENRLINAQVVGRVAMAEDRLDEEDGFLGMVDELHAIVGEHQVDRVIIAPGFGSSVELLEVIRYAKSLGVRVSLLPRLFEVVGSAVRIDELDGLTLLGLRDYGLSRSSRALKRSFDIAVAGSISLLTAPLMITIALAIRLDTKGSVFFRQPRVGMNGHHFNILKFRSMVDNAEELKAALRERNEAGDGLFKMASDPRVTRVGALLRATSLDELPQLLNVLRGDMSLVGPRPLVPEDDRNIQGWDRRRLVVPPGMTGPWQVLGSSRIPMHEMVKIDYLYAANWSLWADLKLIARTVPLVWGRRGV